MSNPPGPLELRITRHIAALPARVFDAWFDPATMARFLFATPGGVMQQVDNEARVGGRFTVVERRPGGDASHYGVWLELERLPVWSSRSRPSATTRRRIA